MDIEELDVKDVYSQLHTLPDDSKSLELVFEVDEFSVNKVFLKPLGVLNPEASFRRFIANLESLTRDRLDFTNDDRSIIGSIIISGEHIDFLGDKKSIRINKSASKFLVREMNYSLFGIPRPSLFGF